MTQEEVFKLISSGLMGFILAAMLLVYLSLWALAYQGSGIRGVLALVGFHLLTYISAQQVYVTAF